MVTKNNCYFNDDVVKVDLERLVNKIFKLLPMRENNEDWQKQLNSVLIELYGLNEMFGDQLQVLILLSKLEGLSHINDFMTYRVTVFNAITLLTNIINKIND